MTVCRRRVSAFTASILLTAAWGGSGLAQLPSDLYTTPRPLSAEQQATLTDFAQRGLSNLKSNDSRLLAEARRALSTAFRRDTSRTFRMAYNSALAPGLAAIAADVEASMAARQAAIWLLGPLASDESDAALFAVLQAEEPALRYAAAAGLERSMLAIRPEKHTYSNPIANEKTVARMLREALSSETDPNVVRALSAAAAALPSPGDSIDTLAEALAAQVHQVDRDGRWERLEPIRVGFERMQKRYVVDMFGGQAIAAHERKIVEASASALLLTVRHGKANKITEPNRAAYADLARTSENLLNLLCRRDSTQTRVASAIGAGRADDADAAMNSVWLSAAGPIYANRAWEIPPRSIETGFDR